MLAVGTVGVAVIIALAAGLSAPWSTGVEPLPTTDTPMAPDPVGNTPAPASGGNAGPAASASGPSMSEPPPRGAAPSSATVAGGDPKTAPVPPISDREKALVTPPANVPRASGQEDVAGKAPRTVDPGEVARLVLRAQNARGDGDFEAALSYYTQALALAPDNFSIASNVAGLRAELLYRQATRALEAGNINVARRILAEVEQLVPGSLTADQLRREIETAAEKVGKPKGPDRPV